LQGIDEQARKEVHDKAGKMHMEGFFFLLGEFFLDSLKVLINCRMVIVPVTLRNFRLGAFESSL
jgi:hypothetical protein